MKKGKATKLVSLAGRQKAKKIKLRITDDPRAKTRKIK